MPPLTPEDAQLQIEPRFAASLEAASKEIERIIKEINEDRNPVLLPASSLLDRLHMHNPQGSTLNALTNTRK